MYGLANHCVTAAPTIQKKSDELNPKGASLFKIVGDSYRPEAIPAADNAAVVFYRVTSAEAPFAWLHAESYSPHGRLL